MKSVDVLEPAAGVEVGDQADRDPERADREEQRDEAGAQAAVLVAARQQRRDTPPASGRKIRTRASSSRSPIRK